jgi:putative transposase
MDGAEYRLSRKVSDTLWQLEEAKTKRIIEHEHDQLLRKFAEGTLELVGSGKITHCGPANSDISSEKFEIAKHRRLYVLRVLNVPNSQEPLERAIAEVWEKIKTPVKKPSYATVYLWKRRYLESKGDIRTLVDNTNGKGNRDPRYPPEVLELCNRAIEAKFLRRERNTIQETLEDAIIRVKRENELRPNDMALPVPTRRLITRLIEKIPAFDKYSARYGSEAARKTYRSLKGHVVTEAPLQRAQIDHTILDLFVVDDETHLPLGRPYLTACIDDFTRCILGTYVGFIPPSYQTVALCIKDCFLPKVHLKEEYPSIKSEWPAHGVMRELVLDNGLEFHSLSLEQVCYSLGIEMHYSPRREPWFKGKIERFFGTMNRGIAHGNPGTTFSNIFEKDDYDPAKHAVITLSTLKEIVRKWIADVYHQMPHSSIHKTPATMWRSNIKPEDIRLPDNDTHLDAIVGRSYQRVLTHKGIEFEGLFYNSPDLTALRYQEGSKLDVEIRVDESNIGSIYVVWPQTSRTYSVPALDPDYATGISLRQHKIFKKWQARRPDMDQSPVGWLEAKEEIQRMVEEDLSFKRKKTRKRVARFVEDSERGAAKTDKRKATPPPSVSPSSAAPDSSLTEDTHFEPTQFHNEASYAVMGVTDDIPDFTPIYRKESENE